MEKGFRIEGKEKSSTHLVKSWPGFGELEHTQLEESEEASCAHGARLIIVIDNSLSYYSIASINEQYAYQSKGAEH